LEASGAASALLTAGMEKVMGGNAGAALYCSTPVAAPLLTWPSYSSESPIKVAEALAANTSR
jgi:hypothetical protein